MNIKDLITVDTILELRQTDKKRVLAALSQLAADNLAVDPQQVLKALARREELGSTGIGNGVAIPHARLAEIDRTFGCLAILRPAVQFGAIDDQPVDLVFLLLLPDRLPEAQLRPMACVARRLRDPALTEKLRRLQDPLSIYEVLVADV